MAANKSAVAVQLTTPPPPGLQESVRHSTIQWQQDLEQLFKEAKDRFPDVVWELVGGDDDNDDDAVANLQPRISTATPRVDEVWGHKAIVYARAPPSFQSRYFSFRPNPYSSSPTDENFQSTASLDIPPSMISRSPSPSSSSVLRITTSINPTLFSNELEYLYTGQGFGEAFEFLFDSAGSEDGTEDLRIDKLRKDLVFMWRSRLYSDVRIALTSAPDNTTAIFSSHRFILVSRCPYFHTLLVSWGGTDSPTVTLPSPPFTPASLHFTLGYIYTGTLVFSHRSYDLSTAFAILRAALYLGLTALHDEIQARIAHEMLHGLFHAFLPFPEYEALTQGRWGTGGCRCRQCARRVPRVLEFSLADDVRNAHLERGARRALVGMYGEGWCTAEFAGLPLKLRESLLKGVGKRTTTANAFALLFAAEHALVKVGSVVEPWADTVREMVGMARKVVDEIIAKESDACFSSEEWLAIMESESEGGRFGDLEKVEWAMASALRGVKEPWAATLYQTLVSGILLKPHPTEETEPMLSATSQVRVVVEETRLELLKWIGRRWIMVRQEQGFDNLEGWALKEISDHIEVPIEDLINPNPPPRTSPARAAGNAKTKSTLLRPMSHHPHTSRIDTDSDTAGSMRASVLTRNSRAPHLSTITGSSASTLSSLTTAASRRAGAASRSGTPTRGGDGASVTPSVRSSVASLRSTATFESAGSGSTVGRSVAVRRRGATGGASGKASPSGRNNAEGEDSPAKRIAASVRAKNAAVRRVKSGGEKEDRPDSKLTPERNLAGGSRTPSIIESQFDHEDLEDEYDQESVFGGEVDSPDADTNEGLDGQAGQDAHGNNSDNEDERDSTPANSMMSNTITGTTASRKPVRGGPGATGRTPPKKMLITKASLSSLASAKGGAGPRSKSNSAASLRSVNSSNVTSSPSIRKTSGGSSSTLSVSTRNLGSSGARPSSRGSTRSTVTTGTMHSRTTMSTNTNTTGSRASTMTLSTLNSNQSRPVSRSSVSSSSALSVSTSVRGGARPVSSVSGTTDNSFRTASSGGRTPLGVTPTTPGTPAGSRTTKPRPRTTSATSTLSVKSTATARTTGAASPVATRQRKASAGSVSSVASTGRSPATRKGVQPPPPVPAIDPKKLGAGVKAPSVRSVVSTGGVRRPVIEKKKSVGALSGAARKGVSGAKEEKKVVVVEAGEDVKMDVDVEEGSSNGKLDVGGEGKEKEVEQAPVPDRSPDKQVVNELPPAAAQAPSEHRKTSSSASTSSVSSVATVKRRGSVDTITTVRSRGSSGQGQQQRGSGGPSHGTFSPGRSTASSPPLPPVPFEDEDESPEEHTHAGPRGATLDIGIPCIIASKRKRFKAYARYIGEVQGEDGPWVGVEVPLPVSGSSGDAWGDRSAVYSSMSMNSNGGGSVWPDDDRQWNDGTWGGVRYFEISGGVGADWSEDRASRRRRIDGGSAGAGAMWGSVPSSAGLNGKSSLKRDAEMSMSLERMVKRVRSVSPAGSDTSSMTESRGLFVRPQQVLYVVDAVGADL